MQEGDGGLNANYCSADNITTVVIDEQGGGSITLKFVGDYEADNFRLQQLKWPGNLRSAGRRLKARAIGGDDG